MQIFVPAIISFLKTLTASVVRTSKIDNKFHGKRGIVFLISNKSKNTLVKVQEYHKSWKARKLHYQYLHYFSSSSSHHLYNEKSWWRQQYSSGDVSTKPSPSCVWQILKKKTALDNGALCEEFVSRILRYNNQAGFLSGEYNIRIETRKREIKFDSQ